MHLPVAADPQIVLTVCEKRVHSVHVHRGHSVLVSLAFIHGRRQYGSYQ